MIVTTTPQIAGKTIVAYKGIVFGETVNLMPLGFNFASANNKLEPLLLGAKRQALSALINNAAQVGANAVVGISFNFNHGNSIVIVSATGTAVVVE